jgi:hypothetical protein
MPAELKGGDPEQPRDLVGPPAVVTGVVDEIEGRTVLDTPAGRWVLTGEPVAGLRAGDRVTVRGWRQGVPADRVLRVFLVSR